jgi:hypothetical protein
VFLGPRVAMPRDDGITSQQKKNTSTKAQGRLTVPPKEAR